jgi:hypothetical protein
MTRTDAEKIDAGVRRYVTWWGFVDRNDKRCSWRDSPWGEDFPKGNETLLFLWRSGNLCGSYMVSILIIDRLRAEFAESFNRDVGGYIDKVLDDDEGRSESVTWETEGLSDNGDCRGSLRYFDHDWDDEDRCTKCGARFCESPAGADGFIETDGGKEP